MSYYVFIFSIFKQTIRFNLYLDIYIESTKIQKYMIRMWFSVDFFVLFFKKIFSVAVSYRFCNTQFQTVTIYHGFIFLLGRSKPVQFYGWLNCITVIFLSLLIISQCPPLSGPTRFIRPLFFIFRIFQFKPSRVNPHASHKYSIVT